MVTKDAWRTEAPALIKAELEKRLDSECKIIAVEPDSFYHDGEEHRHVTVVFKGAHPCKDHRRLGAIQRDIYQMLWERDYDPIPAIYYQEEGTDYLV